MRKHQRPFLRGAAVRSQIVGVRGKDGVEENVARISHDRTWLRIVDGEDHVIINIETLPQLRRALARIAKQRKAAGIK